MERAVQKYRKKRKSKNTASSIQISALEGGAGLEGGAELGGGAELEGGGGLEGAAEYAWGQSMQSLRGLKREWEGRYC